ncbi:hypothetical protein A3C37_02060 [Candidatus Peribacteria bacterium RIFCSPHIGHO2_02_FULL_53_20]|nr:MAG: hypothetical protein A3C37_02060 [Candidatus Peribacteria bacterium RIFCSPHIGHO2_02_FULL_53_20]OGJ66571.1 MAG: hypothetical protein A3B61_01500 [Candidatus Peribacteria bacterium RIFCSPLOWO2_01_FULL_53_10]
MPSLHAVKGPQQILPQGVGHEEVLEAFEELPPEEERPLEGADDVLLLWELAAPWQSLSELHKSGPAPQAVESQLATPV